MIHGVYCPTQLLVVLVGAVGAANSTEGSASDLHGGEPTLEVDLLSLAKSFRRVMEGKRLRTPQVFAPSRYTVRDRVQHVLSVLEAAGRDGPGTPFRSLFEEGTVEEAVVTFLGLLELIKRGYVRCVQRRADEDISIRLVPEADRPSGDAFGPSEFDALPADDETERSDGPEQEDV